VLDSAYNHLKKLDVNKFPSIFIHYYFLVNDYPSIIALLNKNKDLKIDDAYTHYRIGEAFEANGDFQSALSYFDKATQKEPFNLDFQLKKGTSLLYLKDIAEAKKIFEWVIQENEKLPVAHNNLGFAYLLEGDLFNASISVNKSIKLDPDYLPALLNQVKIDWQKGNIFQAKSKLNGLLKRFPSNTDIINLQKLINQNG
jgi:tetratricopeptide (TPR) repeat protein